MTKENVVQSDTTSPVQELTFTQIKRKLVVWVNRFERVLCSFKNCNRSYTLCRDDTGPIVYPLSKLRHTEFYNDGAVKLTTNTICDGSLHGYLRGAHGVDAVIEANGFFVHASLYVEANMQMHLKVFDAGNKVGTILDITWDISKELEITDYGAQKRKWVRESNKWFSDVFRRMLRDAVGKSFEAQHAYHDMCRIGIPFSVQTIEKISGSAESEMLLFTPVKTVKTMKKRSQK